jgi:hypothetical protein
MYIPRDISHLCRQSLIKQGSQVICRSQGSVLAEGQPLYPLRKSLGIGKYLLLTSPAVVSCYSQVQYVAIQHSK